MAKIVSMRRPALLPFPDRAMKRGERATVVSEPAVGKSFIVRSLLVADECRPHLRIMIHERTSDKWVSADLAERLPMAQSVSAGDVFEIEVQCVEDCTFSAALGGEQVIE